MRQELRLQQIFVKWYFTVPKMTCVFVHSVVDWTQIVEATFTVKVTAVFAVCELHEISETKIYYAISSLKVSAF